MDLFSTSVKEVYGCGCLNLYNTRIFQMWFTCLPLQARILIVDGSAGDHYNSTLQASCSYIARYTITHRKSVVPVYIVVATR